MLAFEISSVKGKEKQRKFRVKVLMWLYEVSYITIFYEIIISNRYSSLLTEIAEFYFSEV